MSFQIRTPREFSNYFLNQNHYVSVVDWAMASLLGTARAMSHAGNHDPRYFNGDKNTEDNIRGVLPEIFLLNKMFTIDPDSSITKYMQDHLFIAGTGRSSPLPDVFVPPDDWLEIKTARCEISSRGVFVGKQKHHQLHAQWPYFAFFYLGKYSNLTWVTRAFGYESIEKWATHDFKNESGEVTRSTYFCDHVWMGENAFTAESLDRDDFADVCAHRYSDEEVEGTMEDGAVQDRLVELLPSMRPWIMQWRDSYGERISA